MAFVSHLGLKTVVLSAILILCFGCVTIIFRNKSQSLIEKLRKTMESQLNSRIIANVELNTPETNNMDFSNWDDQVIPIQAVLNEMDEDRVHSKIRIANKVQTDIDSELRARFKDIVRRNLSASDPELVAIARQMIDWPSTMPIKPSIGARHTPQSKYIMDYVLPIHEPGFFIECGALDGERSSNTFFLEHHLGWSGLLIEADPYYYTQLLGKNRHSWSINACLSPTNKAEWLTFKGNSGGKGKVASLSKSSSITREVPCFSLETLMLALNRTKIDFFSLDVEGLEMHILQSIPHNKLDIRSWTIEYDKVDTKELEKFMTSQGYEYVDRIDYRDTKIHMFTHDFIFKKV